MSDDYLTNKWDEPLFNCQQCGTPEAAYYIEETRIRLIHHQLCFNCDFWVQRFFRHITDPDSMIVEGQAYVAYPFNTSSRSTMRGYGGRVFTFKRLSDGSTFESNDVWHQGVIPEWIRCVMPDNAMMVAAAQASFL